MKISRLPVTARQEPTISALIRAENSQNADTHKTLIAAACFFFFSSFTNILASIPCCLQSALFHNRNGQFSVLLVPSIRRSTGSKVHAATASTFTLRGASVCCPPGSASWREVQRQKRSESGVNANSRNHQWRKRYSYLQGTLFPLQDRGGNGLKSWLSEC